MSQDVKMSDINSSVVNDVNRDEIDLLDLIKSIWSQRGLVLGFMLVAVLAVLSFHFSKASFSIADRVDYPVSLPFLTDDNLSYPNGISFSPRDLITGAVLQSSIKTSGLGLSLEALENSITVASSNSILSKSEEKLSVLLANAKTPEDIRLAAETSLQYLKETGRGYITLSLNLKGLGINAQQGTALLEMLVDEWARSSLERGLMNLDIALPLVPFTISEESNLIDTYDQATSYLKSLTSAVLQLSDLSGTSSLIVDGMSLADVERRLSALRDFDIGPLRAFAYSNSSSLANSDSSIQVRLFSRQRLLNLEHVRLTKLIGSYDLALVQLGTDNNQQYSGKSNVSNQGNSAQFDQSFLDSLLQLGTKLGAVDTRKQLFENRIQAVEELLMLEKEIAILLGTSSDKELKINPNIILKGALVTIQKDLNGIQQNVGQFVDAIRELTLESHTQVYIANSAPQVRGGFMQLAPRFALFVVLGAILGLFLGVFVALIRLALLKNK